MTKTIEEAANEYAANWEAKHNIHNPELYGLIVDAYKASAERIMTLPLAKRLTAEEKERVRKEYANILSNAVYYKSMMSKTDDPICITHHCNSLEFYVAQIKLLERIFGSDFFKEGE